jgi:uncharacterized membrane protein
MIVHFPVALLPMDVGLYVAGKFFDNPSLSQPAYYCLFAGVAIGWLAVITGLLDLFLNIIKHGKEALQRAYMHGTIQSIVVTGFTVIASVEYKNPDLIASHPLWMLVTKVMLVIILFGGNYLGGELLLKYVSRDFQG